MEKIPFTKIVKKNRNFVMEMNQRNNYNTNIVRMKREKKTIYFIKEVNCTKEKVHERVELEVEV